MPGSVGRSSDYKVDGTLPDLHSTKSAEITRSPEFVLQYFHAAKIFALTKGRRYVDPVAITQTLNATVETMAISSDRDIVAARQRGRIYVLQLGFSSPEATLIATAISELARNIVLYAQQGQIELQSVERDGRPGVLIIARDDGPGISDVLRAAIDAPSDRGGVMGLRAMKRLVDEFEIDSHAGQGTRVAVKKWKA